MRARQLSDGAAVLAACLFTAGTAGATTIDFSTLPGPPFAAFTSYSEFGFTVSTTTGLWAQSISFGNPAPDIEATLVSSSSVTVTEGGLPFTFGSVDLASAAREVSSIPYVITGFLGGTEVFTQTGTVDGPGPLPPFTTVASVDAGAQIDSLVIVLGASIGKGHLDNIALDVPIPEPASLSLLGLATAVVGLARRRRRV